MDGWTVCLRDHAPYSFPYCVKPVRLLCTLWYSMLCLVEAGLVSSRRARRNARCGAGPPELGANVSFLAVDPGAQPASLSWAGPQARFFAWVPRDFRPFRWLVSLQRLSRFLSSLPESSQQAHTLLLFLLLFHLHHEPANSAGSGRSQHHTPRLRFGNGFLNSLELS
jgi:hypothetical protein